MALGILSSLLTLGFLCGAPYSVTAQEVSRSQAGSGTAPAEQAILPLNGPWKFHVGDDSRWSAASLDDSDWEPYLIAPEPRSAVLDQTLNAGPLPGWQAHGHPGYTGYAWYRIRVGPQTASRAYALLMPQYVDESYEVYIDGKKMAAFGQLDEHHLHYGSRPLIVSIPQETLEQHRPFTVAIRFWDGRSDAGPREGNLHGGLRGLPLLGPQDILEILRENQRNRQNHEMWLVFLLLCLFGAVGLISFFLFAVARNRPEYLWAGISMAGVALKFASQCASAFLPIPVEICAIFEVTGEWVGLSAGPVFVMYLLGLNKRIWSRMALCSSIILLARTVLIAASLNDLIPPASVWNRLWIIVPFALFCTIVLVAAIVIDAVRTNGRRSLAPLSPGALAVCGLVSQLLGGRIADLTGEFFASVPVALLFVFLWRFTLQQRQNERNAIDLTEAQEIQQLLLGTHLPQVTGYEIESAYFPAREVGGDFFQVLEADNGSMLIVFGDVAGKGFPAAVLVSLLVGVIRTRAQETHDPGSVLHTLNNRLCETARGSLATCLAARISPEGLVDVASAGHLPPYLDGEELSMPGSLPLGALPGVEYDTHNFALGRGGRLMLASDGVVEARNSRGELFGFDRVRSLSMEAAEKIALAARQFGQEDDITVLTIEGTIHSRE